MKDANMNDKSPIWLVCISDNRGYYEDGPLETTKCFSQETNARKWLANWIKEEIMDEENEEGEDDENKDKDKQRKRWLALIEGGQYDTLFREYQDEWDDDVLKLYVLEEEVS
jgi:hypothetical protein